MHDPIQWRCSWKLEKFRAPDIIPYNVIYEKGNLLVTGGASAMWELLINSGAIDPFDNTNAYIGVGDSSASEVTTQTDLQASSNKSLKPMQPSYPLHTDSTSSAGAKSIDYKSSWSTADANFAWNEWGIFNAASSGRMLNRKVASLGTKTSADTWTLTVTLSLA